MSNTPTTPCVLWEGEIRKRDGRARLYNRYAYRVLWEREHGPLDSKTILHHLCGTAACVNLAHLEPMSQAEHVARHFTKTHCKRGHEYTEENTYWLSGHRWCRACNRVRSHPKRCADCAKPITRLATRCRACRFSALKTTGVNR